MRPPFLRTALGVAVLAAGAALAASGCSHAPGDEPAAAPRTAPAPRTTSAPARRGVLAVGDSVMLGAGPAVRAALPGATIDARVSRQFAEGAAAVMAGERRHRPDTIVIHLGDNGYVPFRRLEALMRRLASTPRVVLVTVRVPLRWERSVNDALRYAARHHRNVVLADWHAASRAPGLLVDGVHTTPKGAKVYARTIRRAVMRGR